MAKIEGTIFTYPDNFRAHKGLIAANYSGAKVGLSETFVFGETNKSEEFVKKFPNGKVPVLETTDGKFVFESNAIAFYLANEQLRGKTVIDQAHIWQWIAFSENEIVPSSCAWVFPLLGIMPFNKVNVERAKIDVSRALNVLNTKLLDSTYLVGERITLADIIVFCNLLHLYEYVLEPSVRGPYGNVTRWFTTMLNQEEVKSVLKKCPNTFICETAIEFDPKKYAEFQASSGVGKVATAGKAKEEKKEKKPSAPAKKEADEEMDAMDEALALEPKTKDPFETMPKGTFVMDDFKRCYSNSDDTVSIPYFWKNFDAENYSIWFSEYKYSSELTQVFMSCNLIGGMFQRLDKMRKQAFASVCLFGDNNNSSISGIWVWRGQELAFPLSSDWQIDYDCYTWKKLSPDAEETKKLVSQYFAWVGEDDKGRKFNQGKIFK